MSQSAINVMTGKNYEQEFELEVARMAVRQKKHSANPLKLVLLQGPAPPSPLPPLPSPILP